MSWKTPNRPVALPFSSHSQMPAGVDDADLTVVGAAHALAEIEAGLVADGGLDDLGDAGAVVLVVEVHGAAAPGHVGLRVAAEDVVDFRRPVGGIVEQVEAPVADVGQLFGQLQRVAVLRQFAPGLKLFALVSRRSRAGKTA